MKYKSIKEVIEQLSKCKFIDQNGHPLENNIAFIELLDMSERTLMPSYKPGDILWFMKNNKPTKIKISASEIFNVDSNQARIIYSAEDCVNPITWIDHQYLQESHLFNSKDELLKSL